ncbi:MAG: response regulator transcription factor [Flavobacterium sp.]|nr:response regulator transcription factor [Flavobacterium sp.]
MKQLSVLIVDDHRMMVDGYVNVLKKIENYEISFAFAYDCETAESLLNEIEKYDLAIIDRALPQSLKYRNGEDIAKFIRLNNEYCKILMVTSHAEAFILYDLIKGIGPDGVLVKSDFNSAEMLCAVENILRDGEYFSLSVKQAVRKITSENNYLDSYNRQIIFLLSQGIKTKSLSNHLPLSPSAIDKRKVYIKTYFNIESGDDQDIVKEARERGLI